ncbi:MAG: hypothetical protein ACI31A_10380 [Candidatus Limisoma sp.]
MKRKNYILLLAAAAMLTTSCRDDLRTGNSRNDGRIAFTVDSGNDWQTRAAADSTAIETYHIQQKMMPIIVGNDTLMLTLTIEPNIGIEAPAPAETRSAPVTTATLKGFNMKAYMEDNGQLFFSKYYAWSAGQVVNTEHFWPNNRKVTFCADAMQAINKFEGSIDQKYVNQTPVVDTFNPTYTMSEGTVTGTFNYTSPCSGAQNSNWFDAIVQPDPVVAIKRNQAKQDSDVPLVFHHPLAAIRFKVGTVPEQILVRDTYLKNIYQSGDCSFVASGTDDITFTWTNQDTGDKVNYIQSNWKQVASSSSGTEINHGSTTFDDCTFFVVPQTLANDAEIGFDYHLAQERNQSDAKTDPSGSDETHYSIFKAFSAFGVTKLEADTRYTFTLSLAGSMGISVTDALDTSTKIKSNVVIKNTGKSTGYVRAAIVGWWKNTAGNIVAPWNDLPNESCTYGEYKTAADWSSYWKKGSDGFFYYRRSLLPQKVTDRDLFDEYKLTGSAPVTEAILEIDIVAQIIRIDADLAACDWNFPTW